MIPCPGGGQEKGEEANSSHHFLGLWKPAHILLAPRRQQEQTFVPIYLGNCLFFRPGEGEGNLKENIQPHACEISA